MYTLDIYVHASNVMWMYMLAMYTLATYVTHFAQIISAVVNSGRKRKSVIRKDRLQYVVMTLS